MRDKGREPGAQGDTTSIELTDSRRSYVEAKGDDSSLEAEQSSPRNASRDSGTKASLMKRTRREGHGVMGGGWMMTDRRGW